MTDKANACPSGPCAAPPTKAKDCRSKDSNWWPAFAVLITPSLVLLFSILLTTVLPNRTLTLNPWCVTKVQGYPYGSQTIGYRHDFNPPPKSRDACDIAPVAPLATPALSSTLNSVTLSPSVITPDHAPRTYVQVIARELDLELGFYTASIITRSISIIVLFSSVGYLINQLFKPKCSYQIVVLYIFTIFAGTFIGWRFSKGLPISNALIIEPITTVSNWYRFTGNILMLQKAGLANLVIGYTAAGALLAMFAQIARSRESASVRLTALQIALLLGAGLFTSGSYALAQLAEWAKGLLDPTLMINAKDVIDRVPSLSAAISSLFLVTTAGTTYIFIRKDSERLFIEPQLGSGSVLDTKTLNGQDLKFFGWLVNFLLLLSPVWGALKFPTFQLFQ